MDGSIQDVLTVNNVKRLQALNSRIFGIKGSYSYQTCFKISFKTPVKYTDTILDMHLGKIYTYQKYVPIWKTNNSLHSDYSLEPAFYSP